ncbi:unnamed protein product [Cuscuta campestris]|uniref:Ubiquitin-like protease family profile domain-containing protein n=1 Tax=Cuscuta campestris TaxID=132261 RepID=A0A484KJV6_9ASTE|nr:unnamed protein product [Cuscuta campestris]
MCDEELLVGKTGVKVTCFCNVWVGAKIVEGVVSDADLVELKESAFGDFFNLGGIKWFTGQLMILLALNYVEPLKRSGCVDSLKFHIGDKVVEFKKTDFALITGLKFGKETKFEGIDMDEPNDISLRFFRGKMTVTRLDVEHVFKNIRAIGCRQPMDVVKLALLYLLCCHVVGNQGRTKILALYMHLVNDVKRFNDFEWGEHLWTDLVESMGRCSSILNTGGNGRFTFPGFLFPLQIWPFETFPRLMENGICAIGKGTGSLWPRALRWETGVWPKHDVLENSIFGKPGESVIWKEMVAKPMERVMGNIETLLSVGGAVEDPLNDVSTQEVEGRWRQAVEGLGLNLDSGKGAGSRASTSNGVCAGVPETVNGTVTGAVVGGFCDRFETASQIVESLGDVMFACLEFVECVEFYAQEVTPEKIFSENVRPVDEEIVDDGADEEMLNEEPCTQIVVYEEPIRVEIPREIKDRQKRPLKCPQRFSPDQLIVRRKRKKVRTVMEHVIDFGGDGDDFMGPFTLDPAEMPGEDDLRDVDEFMHKGLLKKHKKEPGRKYCVNEDVLAPSEFKTHYDDKATLTKSWYYEIYFPWGWLSDTHLDVIFYYLRMKGVEFGLVQRYTTTDTPFLELMKTLCDRYLKKELTIEQATRNKSIRSTIVGGRMEYGRPWQGVDFVYMPLNTGSHCTLLVLDITRKVIRTYDSSLRRNDSKRKLQQFMPSLQMFLPKMMDKLGVYEGQEEGLIGDGVLAIEGGSCCPQQNDGSSCGMFVVKMTEFLMMGRDVRDMGDDEIAAYRKKMTTELLAYSGK